MGLMYLFDVLEKRMRGGFEYFFVFALVILQLLLYIFLLFFRMIVSNNRSSRFNLFSSNVVKYIVVRENVLNK
jgi:hypothetical protein